MERKTGIWRLAAKPSPIEAIFTATFVAVLVLVLLFAALFGGAGVARASSYSAAAKLEPTPGFAGNVTISTLPYGDSPLTYIPAGGGSSQLVAHVDTSHVANPYSVNPAGIVAPGVLQGTKVAGGLWNNTSLWNAASAAGGQHATGPTLVTVNGLSALQWTINATHAAAETSVIDFKSNIVEALWPSSNPTFDYWTEIWEVSSSVTCASCAAYLSFANASGNGIGEKIAWSNANGGIEPIGSSGSTLSVVPAVGSNSVLYLSASQAQLSSSANLGLNATGPGSTASLNPTIWIGTPLTSTATTITITLVGMAYSTAPLTLGKTYWGGSAAANITRFAAVNNLNLSSLASSFTYTSITGGSFTVAIRQSAADVGLASISQTANPNGSETITYVFDFGLPIAPSLSYGAFKVADTPRLAAWQYASVSFGGAAYTTIYQTKANVGNYTTIVSSVVPTTPAAWVGTVTYTGAEWDQISTGPGLLSLGGLEYDWLIFVGAIMGVLGLGTSGWVINQQRALRVRKGWGRVPGLSLYSALKGRNLKANRLAEGRHIAMLVIAALLVVSGSAAAWAVQTGADPGAAAATFIAAFLVVAAIAAIAFVVYEVGMRYRRHRGA